MILPDPFLGARLYWSLVPGLCRALWAPWMVALGLERNTEGRSGTAREAPSQSRDSVRRPIPPQPKLTVVK